ncbi:MAG: 5-formyltetrahydrofolate cyclo-ligase [Ruminococcaceae bacterium]|nr:5-formyltetrahydrofolate cyclo-ligase [Oscillospiraceae bacterium]
MTVSEEKRALRRICAATRSGIPEAEKATADKALCDCIAAHPAFREADLLLVFSAVRGEPELRPLYERALALGKALAFPVCVGQEMTFHTVDSLDTLRPGRFGILAPPADAPLAYPTARTLCLMPGLAAGRDGTRLGYGGGFYDRFLDTFPGICVFPIYECLLFPTLPTEETDHRVAHIVTEKGELKHRA